MKKDDDRKRSPYTPFVPERDDLEETVGEYDKRHGKISDMEKEAINEEKKNGTYSGGNKYVGGKDGIENSDSSKEWTPGPNARAYYNSLHNESKDKSDNCYIATTIYGDYNAPQVMVLRHYRDNTLSKSKIGQLFIEIYYRLSPPIANRLKNMRRLNIVIRYVLDKFVVRLTRK